ncbi:hypothetical protein AGMMS49938_05810 [Fibrobacterales bacterium]|nr:hypothetical protein AGMMS49938_05810 [Fibrobacterales bacterium]
MRIALFVRTEDLYLENSWSSLTAGILLLPLAYTFALRQFGVHFACIFLFLLVSNDGLLYYSVSSERWIFDAFFIVLILYASTVKKLFLLFLPFYFLYMVLALPDSLQNQYLNLQDSAGIRHGSVIFSLWFKNYFIQIIGRHFINFHWFVFGVFVWINALIFAALFVSGLLLLRTSSVGERPEQRQFISNKNISLVVLASVCVLAVSYFAKLYPLGIPFDDYMRIMRNWAQMQTVGAKYILFIMPIAFIPAAFCIHRIFLKLRLHIFIIVMSILALLAVSANVIRITKGMGTPEITAVMNEAKKFSSPQSLIYLPKSTLPFYKNYAEHNNIEQPYFVIENITEIENADLQDAIFLFAYNDINSVILANKITDHLQKNYSGRIKGFSAKQCGLAVVKTTEVNNFL